MIQPAPGTRPAALSVHALDGVPGDCSGLAQRVGAIATDVLGLPFDVARAQHARMVEVGLLERSMLASREFHRTLAALESLSLGPWARHR